MPASPRSKPEESLVMSYSQPDARGHFGPYGGTFVAETLIHALDELKDAYAQAQRDPAFDAEFRSELPHFVGRPSPVYHAARLSSSSAWTRVSATKLPPYGPKWPVASGCW